MFASLFIYVCMYVCMYIVTHGEDFSAFKNLSMYVCMHECVLINVFMYVHVYALRKEEWFDGSCL